MTGHRCSLGIPIEIPSDAPFDETLMLGALRAITEHILLEHPPTAQGAPKFRIRCWPGDVEVMERLIQLMLDIARSNGIYNSEAEIRGNIDISIELPDPGERATIDYTGWPG